MPQCTFEVNGQSFTVEAPEDMPLLWVLRDMLGISGAKYGCGINVCKACTSLLDGEAIRPCSVKISTAAGHKITTIEGLADGDTLHPVQQAWLEQDVPQCGYCQPGQIMNAVALLSKSPRPTDAEIDDIENVCRCGTYPRIRKAIARAAELMN
ncbi:MAG: (2Fe-2S)-binding protein [Haloechinothrix sp.]